MSRKVLGNDPFSAPTARVGKGTSKSAPRGAKVVMSAKPSRAPREAKATRRREPEPVPPLEPDRALAPTLDEPLPVAPAAPPGAAEAPSTQAGDAAGVSSTNEASETHGAKPLGVSEILAAVEGDPTLRARLREALHEEETPPPWIQTIAVGAPEETTDEGHDEGAMLQSDFYRQHWGRIAMRDRSEATDDFGLDTDYEARWRPTWDFLYDRWWRVAVEGIQHVPAEGAAILVANHGGAIPFDGVMLSTALRREHPARRQLRWLAEDFVFHMPFAGAFVNRIGAVRACQENAERLIRQGNVVALFPEGVKGIGKLYRDRYKLQRFGRGGHIKLAIRTRAPIIPVTIVGNEDTHPMLAGSDRLARILGVPYLPITPTFPWLGPLGLLPLPAKWRILFGEAIQVSHLGPEAANDELLVGRLNEKLRGTIQETLDRALRERRSVFKG